MWLSRSRSINYFLFIHDHENIEMSRAHCILHSITQCPFMATRWYKLAYSFTVVISQRSTSFGHSSFIIKNCKNLSGGRGLSLEATPRFYKNQQESAAESHSANSASWTFMAFLRRAFGSKNSDKTQSNGKMNGEVETITKQTEELSIATTSNGGPDNSYEVATFAMS